MEVKNVGWILVALVGINVIAMAIYSILKAGSDADDHMLADRQYDKN